jgi:hypothetical protein
MVVDLARGTILATALAGERINQVLPAPDGRSLYVTQPGELPDPRAGCVLDRCPFVVRRLAADTLAVEATRDIVGHRRVVVLPSD